MIAYETGFTKCKEQLQRSSVTPNHLFQETSCARTRIEIVHSKSGPAFQKAVMGTGVREFRLPGVVTFLPTASVKGPPCP